MEEGQLQSDPQHPPQDEAPQKGDPSSAQAQLQTSTPAKAAASPSSLDQEETEISVEEKDNASTQIQAKPLWKPIPPLLPETHAETRDQSCQTEEQLQQTSTSSHGHNTGGKNLLPSALLSLHSIHPQT